MSHPKRLSLSNLGGGELNELVERELSKLCENVADPNIKAEAKRSLKVEITVKPDKKRQTAEIAYSVKTALPGVEAGKTTAFIAMERGELGLYGMDTRQGELPLQGTEPAVTEIKPVSQHAVAPAQPAAYAPPEAN